MVPTATSLFYPLRLIKNLDKQMEPNPQSLQWENTQKVIAKIMVARLERVEYQQQQYVWWGLKALFTSNGVIRQFPQQKSIGGVLDNVSNIMRSTKGSLRTIYSLVKTMKERFIVPLVGSYNHNIQSLMYITLSQTPAWQCFLMYSLVRSALSVFHVSLPLQGT